MQHLFYEYLILYRQLSLPGIGTVFLERTSSKLDMSNRQLTAPAYRFRMEAGIDQPDRNLFAWVSASSRLSEWDAVKSLSSFSSEVKEKLAAEGKMIWENVGVFRRDDKGNLALESDSIILSSEFPAMAEKVIREKAEHTLMVGEQEKSSVEMETLFNNPVEKKEYAWIVALILTGLSVVFASWYFSEKGFTPAATGNQSVLRLK